MPVFSRDVTKGIEASRADRPTKPATSVASMRGKEFRVKNMNARSVIKLRSTVINMNASLVAAKLSKSITKDLIRRRSGIYLSGNFSSLASSSRPANEFNEGGLEITTIDDGKNNTFRHQSNPKVVEKNAMPRLAQLRENLKSRKDDGPVLITSASENGKRKSPKPLKASSISWKEVLASAKEYYADDLHLDPSQEMLTDSFGRTHQYLRISLGERCNLRCLYCMPPEGVPLQPTENLLDANEIDRLVNLFTVGGVDKVRLTGGEPLLRKDLPQIISSIAEKPNINSVGITTNAITLSRQLPSLVEAGLTHANISLDTLNDSKFTEITRRKGLSTVLKAIENACAILPKGNVKINCVVMNGFNDNELRDFVDISKDLPVDVRFIEWMPFNDNGWNKDRFLSYEAMMDRITSDESGNAASLKGFKPFDLQRLTDGANDTTKWWQAPDHEGRLGFITSMTEHFCGTCNRVRLTADGQLKVCLFGSAEVSLRDAMREGASDTDLGLIVRAALHKKKFALGGHGNAEGIRKANDNRPMTLIGG